MDRFPRSDSIVQARSGLQTYMAQVYGWMTVGLLLTAFIAWYAANTPAVMMFVFSSKITFFGLIIAQLALVFVLSGLVHKLSAGMATTLFMLYSALTGLTLSSIFIAFLTPSNQLLLKGRMSGVIIYRYALLLVIISVTLATFCTLSSVFMGEFHEVLLLLFSWSLLLFSRLQMNTSFFSAYVYFYRIKRVVLESENASA